MGKTQNKTKEPKFLPVRVLESTRKALKGKVYVHELEIQWSGEPVKISVESPFRYGEFKEFMRHSDINAEFTDFGDCIVRSPNGDERETWIIPAHEITLVKWKWTEKEESEVAE